MKTIQAVIILVFATSAVASDFERHSIKIEPVAIDPRGVTNECSYGVKRVDTNETILGTMTNTNKEIDLGIALKDSVPQRSLVIICNNEAKQKVTYFIDNVEIAETRFFSFAFGNYDLSYKSVFTFANP